MRQLGHSPLLFSGLGLWMLTIIIEERAAAWRHILPAPMPTTSSSPSSYLRDPDGTPKVSKMSRRLHHRCFLPHATSGDGEGDNNAGDAGQGSPTLRKRKRHGSMPAASSSNDNAALTFARIVIESNQATINTVDDKLDKALGKWLDKEECEV